MDVPPHKECSINQIFETENRCITNCTEYQSQFCRPAGGEVCASDLGTYANECEMSKYVCEAYDESHHESINVTHEGKCQGGWNFDICMQRI